MGAVRGGLSTGLNAAGVTQVLTFYVFLYLGTSTSTRAKVKRSIVNSLFGTLAQDDCVSQSRMCLNGWVLLTLIHDKRYVSCRV